MIIDSHTHLMPLNVQQFQEEFKRANLDYAVVMMMPSAITIDNDGEYQLKISKRTLEKMKKDNLILAESCKNNEKYVPFAWLDYRMEDATGFLETLVKEHGFKGLKIHQVFNGAADENYHPLVEKAIKLDVPIMIHTGFREPAKVEYVGELADVFPDGTFISAHMREEYGLNGRFSHIRMAKNRDNVYLECSYVSSIRRLADAVEKLGHERVVFGSDYPMWHGDIKYSQTNVTCARISDEAKAGVLGLNMKGILKI